MDSANGLLEMKSGAHRSRSFQDMAEVAPPEAPAPQLKKTRQPRPGAMTGEVPQVGIHACQEGENDHAEVVVVFEPEGTSLMMGGLHPRASLFEKPVNLEAAKASHSEFRRVMREHGVKVLTVRDILSYGVEDHVGARVELEDLAMKALNYELAEGVGVDELAEEDKFYLSDDYKRNVLEHMSTSQLLDMLLIHPTVHVSPSYRDTGLTASYTFKPLSNLVYTRDQQITTSKGIVMARLRSSVRELEVALMKFCFDKLGVNIVGEVREPGYLEGGDYCPASADLAFVGVGLRSNFEAVQQLMDEDLFGSRRVAVVRDDFEQNQDRMHLDCVFSIIGDDVCIMMDEMMGEESPTRRLVDEWVQDEEGGKYRIAKEGVEFSRYMREEGWHIIPIKASDQLMYGCNVLNLGSSRIISVNPASARRIVKDPHFKGDVQVIDFSPITSMYGAVHCSSQVIKRTKNTVDQQWIQTSDGQRLQWPPKALQETLGPAASAALAAIPGMPPLGPPQQAGAAKN